MMKRKILITGSSGMLGFDLWQELNNYYVLYGVDLTPNSKLQTPNFYKGDITDSNNILDIVKKIKPDIIIHTAAWTDVDGCETDKERAYKVNAQGTENVASAAGAINSLLVYLSTDFVFDGKKKQPYKETDGANPISVYADSKLKGEEAVKRSLSKYLIVRTSWLFGRHGKNFVDMILEKTKTEDALKVVNDQVGSPTYTKDLAKAIRVLLDRVKGQGSRVKGYGIYHISNSGSVSWYDYAKEIIRLAGMKTKVTPISSEELARPAARPAMSILDNAKFIAFTGYRMPRWEDALRAYLKQKR